jgi:hypothetical protein
MNIERNPTKYFTMFMNFTCFCVVICYKLCKTNDLTSWAVFCIFQLMICNECLLKLGLSFVIFLW